jgi:molecular chaperone GrpE (heat shock protein)
MVTVRKAVAAPDEFASAMQQLSAEAEKSLPPTSGPLNQLLGDGAVLAEFKDELESLRARLEVFESAICTKIDKLASLADSNKASELEASFTKIDEQLSAIRSSETVNHRLFDSLHAELLNYRDNFLHESLQKPFIHDLVHLFDDLTSLSEQLQSAAQENVARSNLSQWRDNLENAIHSLVEILHRFEVKEIEPKENVDRSFHRVVSYEPADFPEEDGRIIMRVRRGFFWRGKLIRPEEVIAKRFG